MERIIAQILGIYLTTRIKHDIIRKGKKSDKRRRRSFYGL